MKGTKAYAIYQETDRLCYRLSRLIIDMMVYLTHVVWFSFLLNSFYQILVKSNYDTSTWIAPFNVSVPYLDISTLLAWYIFYVIQGILAYSYSINQSVIVAFFLSCCLCTEALCDHFAITIRATECRELDNSDDRLSNEPPGGKMDKQKHILMREKFIAAVQLHAKVLE